jgi:hypothetical protein
MKRTRPTTIIICLLVLPVTLLGAANSGGGYDGSWESLQKMPVPAWFEDGKIGIFIHWGPYSVIGNRKGGRGYAEHVPKMIYEDAEHYYPYVKERWGANPPDFGYWGGQIEPWQWWSFPKNPCLHFVSTSSHFARFLKSQNLFFSPIT